MSILHFIQAARSALVATLILALVALFSYFVLEPTVSRSATSDFEVSQTITDEISFKVNMPNVTMNGSIGGLTGGYATGTGSAVVETNDPDGYNMSISFANATSMQGNTTSGVIDDYTPTTPGTPDYEWQDNPANGRAQFGFTVTASTSADVADNFKDNGSACGSGSSSANKCWMNGSTTDFTIVNRTSGSADSGATTTIKFKVAIPSNPSPAIPADIYVATATLTALNN